MSFEFKPGDKVRCILTGKEGVLKGCDGDIYPLFLSEVDTFTREGKRFNNHIIPTIELIERPKKKVQKTVEVTAWANIYPSGEHHTHHNKELADSCAYPNRITCVELKGSYTIEVEETT